MGVSSGAFSRASSRLFAHFGEEAVFRGGPDTVVVVLSRNVELIGENGQVDRLVTTASLPASLNPRKGDPLVVGMESWTLDAPLRGAADMVEWVLLPVTP